MGRPGLTAPDGRAGADAGQVVEARGGGAQEHYTGGYAVVTASAEPDIEATTSSGPTVSAQPTAR